jgi:hypothetical protein
MAIIGPLAGREDLIGQTYDAAIGYEDPASGNVTMYGYVLAPGSQFEEATNLQDEEHLVQVASPLSTDRYGRFPKVSQGDWSGGERQEIYVTGTQYYSSSQIDTSKPGHLRALAKYTTATNATDGIGYGLGRLLTSDNQNVVGMGSHAGIGYLVRYNVSTGTFTNVGTASTVMEDVARGGTGIFAFGSNEVILFAGGTITQVSQDGYPTNGTCGLMAQFDGSLYYAIGANGNQLVAVASALGSVNGPVVYTVSTFEQGILCLCDAPTGVALVTGDGVEERNFVYLFDGVNANFIATIPGIVQDMVQANGVVYILTDAPFFVNGIPQPVIYALSGSTISLFDDYRTLDPAFQTTATAVGGCLDTDGEYLYLFHPGLTTKRYRLSSGAVYDCGTPGLTGLNAGHEGCALIQGGIAELTGSGTKLYLVQPELTPNQSGVLVTSFYDWDTPNVHKSFKSIEFSMNTAIVTSGVQVAFKLDNLSNSFTNMTVQVSPSGNTLIAYFPVRTIGFRVMFQITLGSGASAPDVQAISTLATLARTWTMTVACRRGQRTRDPENQEDVQNATSQALIANIMNAYMLAAGNITLWIPDPTVASTPGGAGPMSQVNAQIQDYKRDSLAGPGSGWNRDASGVADFDADVQLVISEIL